MGLGLQTTGALVVDDVLALACSGVGAVYLNGELKLPPPDEPFRGVGSPPST